MEEVGGCVEVKKEGYEGDISGWGGGKDKVSR